MARRRFLGGLDELECQPPGVGELLSTIPPQDNPWRAGLTVGCGADGCAGVPGDPLGIPTEAILAGKRDSGATSKENPITTSHRLRPGMGCDHLRRHLRRAPTTDLDDCEELRPVADTEVHRMRSLAGRARTVLPNIGQDERLKQAAAVAKDVAEPAADDRRRFLPTPTERPPPSLTPACRRPVPSGTSPWANTSWTGTTSAPPRISALWRLSSPTPRSATPALCAGGTPAWLPAPGSRLPPVR
jgi:hypothetical protein